MVLGERMSSGGEGGREPNEVMTPDDSSSACVRLADKETQMAHCHHGLHPLTHLAV